MATPIKIPVVVETVIQHTDTVKTFLLRPLKKYPAFKPGQFLHLALDPYDPASYWPESRVFSIASAPTRAPLKIVFAVKGPFTSRMFREVKEGDELFVKLPYGSFTFLSDRPVVLIAGGTGVTPFLSFLEQCLDKQAGAPISLHYGVRTGADLICGHLLRECAKQLADFEYSCYVEDGSIVDGVGRCRQGIIPIEEIYAENRAETASDYYLSGPLQMIRDFRSYLTAAGVAESSIKVDDWE